MAKRVQSWKIYKVFLMQGNKGMGFCYRTIHRKGTEGNEAAMRRRYEELYKEPWNPDIEILELERV